MTAKAFGGIFQGTAYDQVYGQYMFTYVSIYHTHTYTYMHNLLYIYVCAFIVASVMSDSLPPYKL